MLLNEKEMCLEETSFYLAKNLTSIRWKYPKTMNAVQVRNKVFMKFFWDRSMLSVLSHFIYIVCLYAPIKCPYCRINKMVVWSCVLFAITWSITHGDSTTCVSSLCECRECGMQVRLILYNEFIYIYVTDGVSWTNSTEWSSMVFVCC